MNKNNLDLKALREIVEKATPGPYRVRHRHVYAKDTDDEMAGLGWQFDEGKGPPEPGLRGIFSRAADAHYAETFDPPMVSALLDRIEAAEVAALGALAEVLRHYGLHDDGCLGRIGKACTCGFSNALTSAFVPQAAAQYREALAVVELRKWAEKVKDKWWSDSRNTWSLGALGEIAALLGDRAKDEKL